MGRGRAKAKQTKVARRLKYTSPSMDLDALRQELSGAAGEQHHGTTREDDESDDDFEDYEDPYADIYDDGDEDEFDDDEPGDGAQHRLG